METLSRRFGDVGEWISRLPCPWCDPSRLAPGAPHDAALRAVLARP